MLKQSPQPAPPIDEVFKALGDPTRRDMVERLGRGPASVSQLAQPLDMSLSAVVQHLAILESCGLVHSEKVGRVRTCRLQPVALELAEDWFAGQRAQWQRRLDRLGEVLAVDRAAEPNTDEEKRAGQDKPDKQKRSTP